MRNSRFRLSTAFAMHNPRAKARIPEQLAGIGPAADFTDRAAGRERRDGGLPVRLAVPIAFMLVQTLLAASPATSQESASSSLCTTSSCVIVVDWGAEPQPSFVDRRFGAPGELERRVFQGLVAAGYRVSTDPGTAGFRIRIRPALAAAMCDRLPGTNPDESCRAFKEVRIDFPEADPTWKLRSLRIPNLCRSNDLMDVAAFSAYVTAMLDYTLARDKSRKRPAARC